MTNRKEKHQCIVDHSIHATYDGMLINELSDILKESIKKDFPKISDNQFICNSHLINYRVSMLNNIITNDTKNNARLNKRLTRVLEKDDFQLIDVEKHLEDSLTFGQKIADSVARFGGSWTFIISFVSVMIVWILINSFTIFGLKFDPFPYILLNLFLSMVAAIQAPLIMMSQNRSASYDRMESKNDYHVNLKSEQEIRLLHSKIDHLIQKDQPNNMEVQRMQIEMLSTIQKQLDNLKN
ncbi:DUF1003 domain-containing protein [Leuconostoc citreum]|uniref:DUF1003 domain-containing protein n=1 Tax=Leuconostoc citreum TaxID=33964 RepID=UPI0032DFA792